MALSGHTTPQLAINEPAALSSYTGTVTGVTAGDLVVVTLELDGTSGTVTPSAFTVTLGSDTLSYVSGSGTATLAIGIAAVFSVVATASGNQTLTVTPSGAPRALSAHAFLIQGFDTTTPIANSGGVNNYGGTVTALTSPNGVTTAASGNVIIGAVSIHAGDVTGLSVATADGSSVGRNGPSTFNDNSWGVAWKETAPAASVTFAWTWTSAQRCGAAWVEINAATGGGGITGTASGSADVTGAATGTVAIQGTASGAADVTGAATGKVAIVGTASGQAGVTGAATGKVGASVFGTASGQAGVTGSAIGKVFIKGTASGQAGVTGAATGKVFIKGVATGQAGVTGFATGSALSAITGTATGQAGVTGTATGVIGGLSGRRARYPAESAHTVTVHSETRHAATFGTVRTVQITG